MEKRFRDLFKKKEGGSESKKRSNPHRGNLTKKTGVSLSRGQRGKKKEK